MKYVLLITALLTLNACGVKGPLEHPERTEQSFTQSVK